VTTTAVQLIVPPQFREAHWAGLRLFLERGEGPVLGRRLELSARHREGHEFPIELTICALQLDGRWGFHAFLRDISKRKRSEEERDALIGQLESLAKTDELTGLWNRRGWEEQLSRELARAAREQGNLCVALLDLDHFEAFNDSRGHQAGDKLLRGVAESWRRHLRLTDVLARYGARSSRSPSPPGRSRPLSRSSSVFAPASPLARPAPPGSWPGTATRAPSSS
jgi:diguanylate cyclase